MSILPPDLLEILGLAQHEVESLATFEPPSAQVGYGLARADAAGSVIDQLTESPSFTPIDFSAKSIHAISRWDRDPAIIVVETEPGAFHPVQGTMLPWEGDAFILDARAERAVARLQSAEGELIVLNEQGHVHFLRPLQSEAFVQRLERLSLDLPRIDLPAPGDLLAGAHCVPWLADAVELLGRSVAVSDRAAALGLIGRLWVPVPSERRPFAPHQETPVDRARALRGALSHTVATAIARAAVDDVDALEHAIDVVVAEVVVDPAAAKPAVVNILERRDDLESVAWLLANTASGRVLLTRLEAFDGIAQTSVSAFASVPNLEDVPRLRDLAWQDPMAWWANF